MPRRHRYDQVEPTDTDDDAIVDTSNMNGDTLHLVLLDSLHTLFELDVPVSSTVLQLKELDVSPDKVPVSYQKHFFRMWTAAPIAASQRLFFFLWLLFCLSVRVAVALEVLPLRGSPNNNAIVADAHASARLLCANLTLEEKISLLHGNPGPYIGNTAAIESLHIPALRLHDGPQGFRTPQRFPKLAGTSTAFPSALSMAASWDVDAVHLWGATMAQEFSAKGANVMLGPGVNVARVPTCGRNFEYLSGEDPVLGAILVKAEIQGIHSVGGIMANVKHFMHNNQEFERDLVSAVVDEQTH